MKDPVLPFWPKKSPNVFSNTPQIPQLKAFLLPRPPFITLYHYENNYFPLYDKTYPKVVVVFIFVFVFFLSWSVQ